MVRNGFFLISAISLITVGLLAAYWRIEVLWSLVILGPLILRGLLDVFQKRHTLLRIYPLIGHGRYFMELIRPEIQQYFVESNIDGTPINREFRSIIYQRAKGQLDTQAFGTQRDVYRVGYEWMAHSIDPQPFVEKEPKVLVGGENCAKPYHASRFNVSAMSYGSLGRNAVMALNRGAKMGGFYHNTGEGGISPYHLKYGGDLVWQIGTGYFGCRTPDGKFDPENFKKNATRETVRMIEIKLSQGAKPAHGGILPAVKLTPEIAEIRGVPMGKDVLSPPHHNAFKTPTQLLEFIAQLRELSGGKPVGFKLCVGNQVEFLSICKAMLATKILPDFITVDGAEGGTGAAPLEFSNSVGMPFREGLAFVHNSLRGIDVRDRIKVIASGKIFTAFQVFKTVALGADVCNSARGMMIALGCIQALRCNENNCPTGVATQDPARNWALDVGTKSLRVERYQEETVRVFLELVGAAGLHSPEDIRPFHVNRRVSATEVMNYSQIYPQLQKGELIGAGPDHHFQPMWDMAGEKAF